MRRAADSHRSAGRQDAQVNITCARKVEITSPIRFIGQPLPAASGRASPIGVAIR